jgi:excisionase family DNA binding protein
MKQDQLEIMTVKEVAVYLKMKPVTIYKLAKEGRIPAFRVASFWRFKKDLIDK